MSRRNDVPTTLVMPRKTFEYGTARVSDLSAVTIDIEKKTKGGRKLQKVKGVKKINIGDRALEPTKRFWTSFQCRFGFSPNIFRYFDHQEVFDRISEKASNDTVKYCIERDNDTGKEVLLAVTNPNNACVRFNNLQDILVRYAAKGLAYSNGIVRSTHTPRIGDDAFKISGDAFSNQFVIDTPIDGFGKPNVYLSLLRMVCSNGAIGFSKAFRSELSMGTKDEDVVFSLIRAMDGFNNEEGFAAMRQRFESATNSWASVNEAQRLYKTLAIASNSGGLKKIGREEVKTSTGTDTIETALPVFNRFHKMTGDISSIYGLANLDSLSTKKQRTLPAACKVYDLINFASEIATHMSYPVGSRRLQAYVGDLISNDYDLEGTVDEFTDWQDFFLKDEAAIESRESISR